MHAREWCADCGAGIMQDKGPIRVPIVPGLVFTLWECSQCGSKIASRPIEPNAAPQRPAGGCRA